MSLVVRTDDDGELCSVEADAGKRHQRGLASAFENLSAARSCTLPHWRRSARQRATVSVTPCCRSRALRSTGPASTMAWEVSNFTTTTTTLSDWKPPCAVQRRLDTALLAHFEDSMALSFHPLRLIRDIPRCGPPAQAVLAAEREDTSAQARVCTASRKSFGLEHKPTSYIA